MTLPTAFAVFSIGIPLVLKELRFAPVVFGPTLSCVAEATDRYCIGLHVNVKQKFLRKTGHVGPTYSKWFTCNEIGAFPYAK